MPLVTDEIEFLRTLVFQRSGNVLSANQGYLLESRLSTVAETAGLPDVNSLIAELKKPSGTRWHDRVAEAMTINETSFFRDLQPFSVLKDSLLPEIRLRKAQEKKLTIWSAASSSGQEAYSLAMTIREHFPEFLAWDVKILATDFTDDMVRRTRDGVYSHFEVNRGLPAKLLVKYFTRQGTQWQAHDDLRQWIDARKLNLTSPFPALPTCDIVFLRNVLIYFDAATKQSLLQKVRRVMAPRSHLFLGGGETLINLNVPFRRVEIGQGVCFCPTT